MFALRHIASSGRAVVVLGEAVPALLVAGFHGPAHSRPFIGPEHLTGQPCTHLLLFGATGDLAKLDTAVFIAIHEQRVAFKNDDAVFTWVGSKGADAKRFADAFNGFSMQSKVQRADQDAIAAKISGVPSLAVDGKYLINSEAAGNYEDLLRITDAVIAKARQERKGK